MRPRYHWLRWAPNRSRIAAEVIARACNADTSARFHDVGRIYVTLGDLEALYEGYVAGWPDADQVVPEAAQHADHVARGGLTAAVAS